MTAAGSSHEHPELERRIGELREDQQRDRDNLFKIANDTRERVASVETKVDLMHGDLKSLASDVRNGKTRRGDSWQRATWTVIVLAITILLAVIGWTVAIAK